MRLGILADIHEDAPRLVRALQLFRQEGTDGVVLLGDVVYSVGEHLRETIALLTEARAVGVWGNHDLGLSHEPDPEMWERYGADVLAFMTTLRPRLELDGYLFTHGLPHWDPTDPMVFYLGDRPETAEGLAGTFASSDHGAYLVGHFHRWLAASPDGLLSWDGTVPLVFQQGHRYLVVVGALCDGHCAILDTDRHELTPHRLG